MSTSSIADAVRKRLNTLNYALDVQIESIHPQQRLVPISHSRHVRGWHPIGRGHLAVQFESKLEAKVISALVRLPEFVGIESQPVTVVYRQDGRIRMYTPDFLVHLNRVPKALARLGFRRETFVEVKPLLRASENEAVLAAKFEVIRQATASAITLITDWDVTALQQEVRHVA